VGVVFIHASDATERSAKLLGRMRPNSGLSLKDLNNLGDELYALMQTAEGATVANIAQQPTLMRLLVAYDEARSGSAHPPSPAAITAALRGLIEQATYPLTARQGATIDEGKAARIYLALEPDSTALLKKDRRTQAVSYIPYENEQSAAKDRPTRPSYERRLLRKVAHNLIEREFDHMRHLVQARRSSTQIERREPLPHAAIYHAHEGAGLLLFALMRFAWRTIGNVITTPSEVASFDTAELTLPIVGCLFLAVEHVPSVELAPHNALIERLSARDALGHICAALPFDEDEVRCLAAIYATGREHSYDVTSNGGALRDHVAITDWISANTFVQELDRVAPLLRSWSQWLACGCSKGHQHGCAVGVAILGLSRYITTLQIAWSQLQIALLNPSLSDLDGWVDRRRNYYKLGLTLDT
jgi:hypothetical protein